MHHYPHHISDFNNATRHLNRLERSIYRDLIELYYDSESQLPKNVQAICRKIIACSSEEATAVQQVLNEFFTETEQGWFHERCDKEITRYKTQINAKSAAGKASAAARKGAQLSDKATAVEHPLNECATNQEPRTKNQEPLKPKSKADALATRLPADWQPSDDDQHFCATERPDLDFRVVVESFRDHWKSQPGAKGRKLDWPATWRNWVRNQWGNQSKGPKNGNHSADIVAAFTGSGGGRREPAPQGQTFDGEFRRSAE